MSKVLIVSDSHGLTEELNELKKRHKDVEKFIHCGDSELSKNDEAIDQFVVVRGNCDYESLFHHDEIIDFKGTKFLVTHGHLYNVKSTLMNLKYKAEEVNANIVCFGHSHLLGIEKIGDSLFINPGSLRLPRGRKERTYVVLNFTEQEVDFHVYDFDRGEIVQLRQSFHLHK